MKIVDFQDNLLYISFSGMSKQQFEKTLTVVRSLTGRSYLNKMWTAPVIQTNIEILQKAGFLFSKNAQILLNKKEDTIQKIQLERELPEIDTSQLQGYFPFQVDGVRFLVGRNGNGIISDEMGLGKSAQSIGYLKLFPTLRPALVICPASLKLNWEKEINRWMPGETIQILYGKEPRAQFLQGSIYIINYDILGIGETIEIVTKEGKKKKVLKGGWFERLNDIKIIIADEIQYVGNDTTFRTKAFVLLCNKTRRKIFLSGTPIKNRPSEFFTALNIIAPNTFPNRWKYLNTFCDPKHNGFGWSFKGLSNGERLHRLIFPLMIRREKKEVLKDLPDKIITTVPLEVDHTNFIQYEVLYNEIFNQDESITRLQRKNNYEKLKQLAYACKRDSVLKWIDDFISTGEKLVVFSYHRAVMDDIEKKFKNISVRIDGSTPSKKRQAIVDRFQTDPAILLFNGQMQAAGVGITLTAASSVCFIEFGWAPSEHEQAGDRCHRIGQRECVNIYYLIAVGTVEEKIVRLLQEKAQIVGKVLDGEAKEFLPDDILDEL